MLLVWTVSDRIVQGQNPQSTHTQTHTHRQFVCPAVQISALVMIHTADKEEDKKDKDTMSTETPSNVRRAPNGSKSLPLFFLPAAHL